jgi:hypothetical protein
MKLVKWILTLGLSLAVSAQVAEAAVKKTGAKTASKKSVAKKNTDELQTDVKFDESTLHGQYQVPEEALAKVENEKALADLIGVRKHFKDRLMTASGQE